MKRFADHPPPHHPPSGAPVAARWRAGLSLGFADDGGVTRMVDRRHVGPLLVQKPLYPEGGRVCHAIVVHPPGGVVGGDELSIGVHAGESACAFLTTPGAAKWYKANGQVSRQDVHLEAEAHAVLEWMPQETILFNAADVVFDTSVLLGKEATFIGSDILCFGRTASGERFDTGQVTQRMSIRREGRLMWFEQGCIAAGSAAMRSPLGLRGKTVCATLLAVGKTVPPPVIQALRDAGMQALQEGDAFGVTQMKSVLVARYLGNTSETAKHIMTRAWQQLRPVLTGRTATVPRIWNT